MNRTVAIKLNDVSPTPSSLRARRKEDVAADSVEINLGQLFHHYYFDSFPKGPPKPDLSRFEYLDLVSADKEFRFHAFVGEASTVKKRSLSAELGQAFCRLMLHDHFGVRYFAHMKDVLDRPTHAAFEGMRIKRKYKGDVPDYLCARRVDRPYIAEAKGRFSAIGFLSAEFRAWRRQFKRIIVLDQQNRKKPLKGFIVATRFVTTAARQSMKTTVLTEDPDTVGDGEFLEEQLRLLGRGAIAIHYAEIFRKLNVFPLASALLNGYPLASELHFDVPVWTCQTPPLEGRHFVGGFYQTQQGQMPTLTNSGWQVPWSLDAGHGVFVGLELNTAVIVARAARGDWHALDTLEPLVPEGNWSSEFSWLADGTVCAPMLAFFPAGSESL